MKRHISQQTIFCEEDGGDPIFLPAAGSSVYIPVVDVSSNQSYVHINRFHNAASNSTSSALKINTQEDMQYTTLAAYSPTLVHTTSIDNSPRIVAIASGRIVPSHIPSPTTSGGMHSGEIGRYHTNDMRLETRGVESLLAPHSVVVVDLVGSMV
jgi:hypothetical protein